MFDSDLDKTFQEQQLATSDSLIQEQSAFALENAQMEIEWLREQIKILEEQLSTRSQQQQEVEQELNQTRQEILLLDQELQQMAETAWLSPKAVKALAKRLFTQQGLTKETVAKLLSSIYGETILPEELGEAQSLDYDQIDWSASRRLLNRSVSLHLSIEQAQESQPSQLDWTLNWSLALRATAVELRTQSTHLRRANKNLRQSQGDRVRQIWQRVQQSQEHIERSKQLLQSK